MAGLLDNSGIGKLSGLLSAISHRQQVTSNNIANVHTPNFTPTHISFADMLGAPANQFETRLAKKMGNSLVSAMAQATDDSGQGVVLQDELMDMQKNLLFYSLATRRLSSLITSLRTAGQVGR
jgi:flagellar basal-body rod protein FlgB